MNLTLYLLIKNLVSCIDFLPTKKLSVSGKYFGVNMPKIYWTGRKYLGPSLSKKFFHKMRVNPREYIKLIHFSKGSKVLISSKLILCLGRHLLSV